MRKYVILKNNRVIRLGECEDLSEITLNAEEVFYTTRGNFSIGDRIFLGQSGSISPDDGSDTESSFQAWQIALASAALGGAGSAIYFFLAGG
jgi:hypothetical protein